MKGKKKMNNLHKPTRWMIALLVTFVTGCGSGTDTTTGLEPSQLAASAAVTGPAPTITSTNPANNASNVPTSTNGSNNVLTGTTVSATFSVAMDPATIRSAPSTRKPAFTLQKTNGAVEPGTVVMNAANTVATFTPVRSALTPNTSYTATVDNTVKSAGGVRMSKTVTWRFTTNAVALTTQAPVNLGAAGTFAVLSKSGITNVFASAIVGDVGTSPITGAAIRLTCPEVTGKIYAVDAAGPAPCSLTDATRLTAAVGAMETAYLDAKGRTSPDFTELGAGQIGGLTLAPGLYKWGTDVLISTSVTLSGGPNDVWIFQVANNLNQANATRINLVGGAVARNVFWQVAGATTIGTSAQFNGIVLGKTLIAMNTGAAANARLYAQTAVTLQRNAITQPAP